MKGTKEKLLEGVRRDKKIAFEGSRSFILPKGELLPSPSDGNRLMPENFIPSSGMIPSFFSSRFQPAGAIHILEETFISLFNRLGSKRRLLNWMINPCLFTSQHGSRVKTKRRKIHFWIFFSLFTLAGERIKSWCVEGRWATHKSLNWRFWLAFSISRTFIRDKTSFPSSATLVKKLREQQSKEEKKCFWLEQIFCHPMKGSQRAFSAPTKPNFLILVDLNNPS